MKQQQEVFFVYRPIRPGDWSDYRVYDNTNLKSWMMKNQYPFNKIGTKYELMEVALYSALTTTATPTFNQLIHMTRICIDCGFCDIIGCEETFDRMGLFTYQEFLTYEKQIAYLVERGLLTKEQLEYEIEFDDIIWQPESEYRNRVNWIYQILERRGVVQLHALLRESQSPIIMSEDDWYPDAELPKRRKQRSTLIIDKETDIDKLTMAYRLLNEQKARLGLNITVDRLFRMMKIREALMAGLTNKEACEYLGIENMNYIKSDRALLRQLGLIPRLPHGETRIVTETSESSSVPTTGEVTTA